MKDCIRRTAGWLFGLVLLLAWSGPARAGFITIDFESLRHDDAAVLTLSPPDIYTEDGFTLTALAPPGNIPRFRTFGTLAVQFPGSTALTHGNGNGEIILTRSDGGRFHLKSIDLAEHPGLSESGVPIDSGPFDITFTGTRPDLTTVTNTFTVDSFLTLDTFHFHRFNDVVSVSWFQGAGPPDSPTHQFDDIEVMARHDNSGRTIARAPEPASLVLFGATMIVPLGVCWRRRRPAA